MTDTRKALEAAGQIVDFTKPLPGGWCRLRIRLAGAHFEYEGPETLGQHAAAVFYKCIDEVYGLNKLDPSQDDPDISAALAALKPGEAT